MTTTLIRKQLEVERDRLSGELAKVNRAILALSDDGVQSPGPITEELTEQETMLVNSLMARPKDTKTLMSELEHAGYNLGDSTASKRSLTQRLLNRLMSRGLIRRVRHGWYEVVSDAKASAADRTSVSDAFSATRSGS